MQTDEDSSFSIVETALLQEADFRDRESAARSIRALISLDVEEAVMFEFLPKLVKAVGQSSTPDVCLAKFERFLQAAPSRFRLIRFLSENPRAVEILTRIFLSSQYLSQILFRVPESVYQFIVRENLIEFKSREQYRDEALLLAEGLTDETAIWNTFRRYQQKEYLRVGTCDAFGLMDLRSVTVQLSLLSDGLVQSCLEVINRQTGISLDGFVVLACGKLGGEELNYSSDIDLLFLSDGDPVGFWPLGQKLIQALSNPTAEGFLYRVDMRLRPWGNSGPLVNSIDSHLKYLRDDARPWERQALLKARVIAGDQRVGARFLKEVDRLIFQQPPADLRDQILQTKQNIEAELTRKGNQWGEVKSGFGSIRDVEFVTQYLQLSHGGDRPELRTFNTLEGLIRLAEFGFLRSDEYRQLSTGYLFLRNVEHALQLMHNKQLHQLPRDPDALEALSLRLDFPSPDQFLQQYESHSASIRRIFQSHLEAPEDRDQQSEVKAADRLVARLSAIEPGYQSVFTEEERRRHLELLSSLTANRPVAIAARQLESHSEWQLIVVGHDDRGILSLICGLLFAGNWNIQEGRVFTNPDLESENHNGTPPDNAPLFLNFFRIEQESECATINRAYWDDYQRQLTELVLRLQTDEARNAQASVARLAALRVGRLPRETFQALAPVHCQIDNETDSQNTILYIQSQDTHGFLYELTNALTLSRVNIVRMIISSENDLVQDTLYITDQDGAKLPDGPQLHELATAVLLIKHCMHLMPAAPNPEIAWLHLREFLEQLFQQPGWYEQMGDLEKPEQLESLTRILGVSDYLWQDFLRLHHDSVLPFVQNVEQFSQQKSAPILRSELAAALAGVSSYEDKKAALNRFKDRETFRTDMRHMLGYIPEFGRFSAELTTVCEVVLEAAFEIARTEVTANYGYPVDHTNRQPCPLTILALGKCGGRELGFASDIELMFLYEGSGRTQGSRVIREAFFFERLIKHFRDLIVARREGIFELDFRLRPYGSAGSLAVSVDAFRTYFAPDGPAWPFERQSLVKMRPVAGDRSLAQKIIAIRDQLIYCGQPFDTTAMHGMREKQIMQLVDAGSINVKLSPGGLVDIEYLIQGLQIAHGERITSIRVPNTLEAIRKLNDARILSNREAEDLIEAYQFLRRVIDALRMVRGNARDLAIPPAGTDEYEFLARRLDFAQDPERLTELFERHSARVLEVTRQLEEAGAFQAANSK